MSLFLGSVAEEPRRYSLPAPELTGWLWRPPGSCAASNGTEAWLRADVCSTSARAPRGLELALERSVVGQALLRQVRGNSSGRWAARTDVHWMATAGGGVTAAGLWWAAQFVRLTLSALGPCGREAVDARPTRFVGGDSANRSGGEAAVAAGGDGAPWTIAVHIRRGDACERWATPPDPSTKPRPCFRTDHYLRSALRLLGVLRRRGSAARPGAAQLLVASDSGAAVAELAQLAAAEGLRVVAVQSDRGEAWGGAVEGAALGLKREAALEHFIERRNGRGLVDRRAVFASLFADLRLLRTADAFVGTASSWTSRLALLAISGETGGLPPFELLDKPLGQLWFA